MATLARKINKKKTNAAKEGIAFLLSKADVVALLSEAGISETQWSHKEFHLARFNDRGDYTIGNCRFITAAENYAEKQASERSRMASRQNAIKMNLAKTAEDRRRISSLGGKASPGGTKKFTSDQLRSIFQRISHLMPFKPRTAAMAAKVLQCSPQHIGRLRKRWAALGLC